MQNDQDQPDQGASSSSSATPDQGASSSSSATPDQGASSSSTPALDAYDRRMAEDREREERFYASLERMAAALERIAHGGQGPA